ncbi:MAG: hypothetical protein GY757_34455 [bacterium]|nr:hypothetical protein [bacterium]
MYILGLGGSNHDFSACLLKDGQVHCMIEDERITRKKYAVGLGIELAKGFSTKYCLEYAGITQKDLELVVGNDILSGTMYKRLEKKIRLINHHMAHAASAYYPSHFSEAAVLIVDAVGSKTTENGETLYESVTFSHGESNTINTLSKNRGRNLKGTDLIENSPGIFYSAVTEVIGFGEHEEGKTMGLAPYGSDTFYNEIRQYIEYTGDGNIRMTEKDIRTLLAMKEMVNKEKNKDKQFKMKADIAWAGQKILEELLLELSRYLFEQTKCRNLCIAGGVGLNSVANYKIYKTGLFKDIFVQPAAADNGTSLGAALFGYYAIHNNLRDHNEGVNYAGL